MNALHEGLWSSPSAHLAEWWQLALQHYDAIAPVPETAFSRKARAPGEDARATPAVSNS